MSEAQSILDTAFENAKNFVLGLDEVRKNNPGFSKKEKEYIIKDLRETASREVDIPVDCSFQLRVLALAAEQERKEKIEEMIKKIENGEIKTAEDIPGMYKELAELTFKNAMKMMLAPRNHRREN